MGHFGEELRKERMSRGIPLETISGSTKIVLRYLSALEDEKFDVLPGGILSKGIVRGYARVVGLDETTWVERFLAASHQQGFAQNEDGWVDFASNVSHSRARMRDPGLMRLRWAGVLALMLVLAGFGWFVWHYVSGRVLASEVQRQSVTSASLPAAQDDTRP